MQFHEVDKILNIEGILIEFYLVDANRLEMIHIKHK